jgi:hypothetical protein
MRKGITIGAAKEVRSKRSGDSLLAFRVSNGLSNRIFNAQFFPFFASPHSTLVSNGLRCNSLQTKNPCTSHPSLVSGAKQDILEAGNGAVECLFPDPVFTTPPKNLPEGDSMSCRLLGSRVGAIMAPLSMMENLLECTRGFLWL